MVETVLTDLCGRLKDRSVMYPATIGQWQTYCRPVKSVEFVYFDGFAYVL